MEVVKAILVEASDLKRAGTAILVLAASILLMGQAATTKTVEANRFISKG